MADVTLSGWPAGATVNAYVAPTVPGVTALGSSVASGTAASDGTVDLTGLTAGVNYVASDGTTRRGFLIPTASSSGAGLPEGANEGDVLSYESGEAVWVAPGAASVGAGDIGTTELADLAVTTGKLADTAVTTAKITDLNVTTAKLAANAVTAAKVAADVATQAELDAVSAVANAAATSAQLTSHASDETAVHGISDANLLVGYNLFNGTSFPSRPDFNVVLWVGGAGADDPTASMQNGDIWFPSAA